jgi:hypothetical protein
MRRGKTGQAEQNSDSKQSRGFHAGLIVRTPTSLIAVASVPWLHGSSH